MFYDGSISENVYLSITISSCDVVAVVTSEKGCRISIRFVSTKEDMSQFQLLSESSMNILSALDDQSSPACCFYHS